MKTFRFAYCAVFISALAVAGTRPVSQYPVVEIQYTKHVLTNGLTLIIHEDHKAPIVCVNVWYHVGSKNEKPGKTGFAHLFEHLMFNGSEHFDDDYFKALEKVGATDLNGTTSEDRTNYFQNVPKDALDYVLWMESDRMGHLLGAITQAKLDEQRGVVQNEKRQGDNQPYAIARRLITENTWPAGHPYSWQVIGSIEDLNAASLEDVKEWFRTYYGAANATLVVAGDVKPQEVIEKVNKYFGDIPPGPPVAKQAVWIAKRTGTHRMRAQDRVPQARIYKVWNIPQYGTTDANTLDLVSDVLASGKTSRLYKRLVYDEQIATDVSASVDLREIAGQFIITATAKPGGSLQPIEKAIDEELNRFMATGPTADELERVKTQAYASFVRSVERIGGFGGKSDVLAMNQVFLNNPDYYKARLAQVRSATARELRDAARRWLSDGQFVLEIEPFPAWSTNKASIDRSRLPEADIKPETRFPPVQRADLQNGLKIVAVQRSAVPIVQFVLLVDSGFAADHGRLPGTARLAMDMLDEGTRKRSALEISDALDRIGARLGTGADLDTAYVSLNTLKERIDEALEIYSDVVLNPAFPAREFERLQKQMLASIQREKVQPNAMALRVLPRLLYGADHPYSNPFSGSGTEDSVGKLSVECLRDFHSTWFKPNNSTLIVVGDFTLTELLPKLERFFGRWRPGKVPAKTITAPPPKEQPAVYILNRPGSHQSVIFAANIAPPKANPDEIAIELVNKILGGDFTSRINMNLREEKHWTYGARSSVPDARGPRPFFVVAPVQADKTKDAMLEIDRELKGILGDKPITQAELDKAVKNQTLRLPGTWETINRIASALSEMVRFGLPDDYYDSYADNVRRQTVASLSAAGAKLVRPNELIWVVVGDRTKIEASVRELGFGQIQLINPDGDLVEQ